MWVLIVLGVIAVAGVIVFIKSKKIHVEKPDPSSTVLPTPPPPSKGTP